MNDAIVVPFIINVHGTIILDSNDMLWLFDGERVYCLLAEFEYLEKGYEHNGYDANTLEEAIAIMRAGGYFE